MKISESDAKDWYETYGIADDDWDEMPDFQQGMVALESVAEDWDEVVDMRETGIPESAVVMYFDPSAIGLDASEVEFRSEEEGYESLTSYVLQNTNSNNVESLFNSDEVGVLSVSHQEGSDGGIYVTIECEADRGIFN